MNRLLIRHENAAQGSARLVLQGVFDGTTALELRSCIERMPNVPLILDFSRVQTFVDLAVAVLADSLMDREVVLHGLPRHQERMFRYFGVVSRDERPGLHVVPNEELLAG
jgi:hypothetical protein